MSQVAPPVDLMALYRKKVLKDFDFPENPAYSNLPPEIRGILNVVGPTSETLTNYEKQVAAYRAAEEKKKKTLLIVGGAVAILLFLSMRGR